MPHETVKHDPDWVREFRERQRFKRRGIPERASKGSGALRGPIRDEGAEPEGMVALLEDMLVSGPVQTMMEEIGKALNFHYPGFRWAVQAIEIGRVFNIFCHDFHDIYGYTLRFQDIDHGIRKQTPGFWGMMIGGEILERFGYSHKVAGKYRYDRDAMLAIPRDMKGRAIPDLSDKMTPFEKKKAEQARIAKGVADGSIRIFADSKGNRFAKITTH